jgi:uncharacterized lipoprotein YajG
MANIRKTHDTQAKVKISIEAIKGSKTTAELTSTYGVHAKFGVDNREHYVIPNNSHCFRMLNFT